MKVNHYGKHVLACHTHLVVLVGVGMGSSAAPGGGGGWEDGGGGPVPVEEGGASLAAVVAPAEARTSGGWY